MNSTRPFAKIPGVTYPNPTAPEVPPEKKPLLVLVPRRTVRSVKVDGRNVSEIWLRKNGFCIRMIGGVRQVVPL